MQITLIQSEIEQALKNYINDIMSVKEGMEIEIQLKATRGEEGTTAIIDIVPLKTKPARPRATGEASGKSDAPRAASTAKSDPAPAQVQVEPAPQAQNESLAEAQADDAEQVADATGDSDTAAEVVAEEAGQLPESPAGEPGRQSLFAGLNRPKNA